MDYLVQTTHPGTIRLEGDTASGRAYVCELIHLRDGSSELNYAIYHDRYQRTPDGWKFTERVYEVPAERIEQGRGISVIPETAIGAGKLRSWTAQLEQGRADSADHDRGGHVGHSPRDHVARRCARAGQAGQPCP